MDGVSLIQVSEGGLNEVSNILVRLRELSIQSASDTIGDTERQFTDREYQMLKQEIDRIANVTAFNGTPLLNGKGGIFEIQVQNLLDQDFRFEGTQSRSPLPQVGVPSFLPFPPELTVFARFTVAL